MFCFLPLLLLALSAYADHHECQNTGGRSAVDHTKSVLWCEASAVTTGAGRSQYVCKGPSGPKGAVDKRERVVADYGVFSSGILEFATPCGNKGYGGLFIYDDNDEWYCAKHWIVAHDGTSYWLAGPDDCSIGVSNAPGKVQIYYQPE